MKRCVFLSIDQKIGLLTKDALAKEDVMSLAGCSRTKAYEIMKTARDLYFGKAGCFVNRITPSSYCKVMGTTLGEQLSALEAARVARLNHEAD